MNATLAREIRAWDQNQRRVRLAYFNERAAESDTAAYAKRRKRAYDQARRARMKEKK